MSLDQRVYAVIGLAFAALVVAVFVASNSGLRPPAGKSASVLPPIVAAGKAAYDTTCVLCHGAGGAGTGMGPPLVHAAYLPDRLDDAAMASAMRNGVTRRNWNFGNMPAQSHLNDSQIAQIIAYLRHLQREAGLL